MMYKNYPAINALIETGEDPGLARQLLDDDLESACGKKDMEDFPQFFSPTPRPFNPYSLD